MTATSGCPYYIPLGANVLERGGVDEREAEDEGAGLRVGHDAEPVVLLLARRVPEVDEQELAARAHLGRVLVEDGGHVAGRELARGVRDEEAGFADCAVAHHHELHCVRGVAIHPAVRLFLFGFFLLLAVYMNMDENKVFFSLFSFNEPNGKYF